MQASPYRQIGTNGLSGDEFYRRIVAVLEECPQLSQREIRDQIAGGRRHDSTSVRTLLKDERLYKEVGGCLRSMHFAGYIEYHLGQWANSTRYLYRSFHLMMRSTPFGIYLLANGIEPTILDDEVQGEHPGQLTDTDVGRIRAVRELMDPFIIRTTTQDSG